MLKKSIFRRFKTLLLFSDNLMSIDKNKGKFRP